MLSPSNGCPGNGVFSEGSWEHSGGGDNSKSDEFHLVGTYSATSFRYRFCVKDDNSDTSDSPQWETGRYCIMRAGGVCPSGMRGTGVL